MRKIYKGSIIAGAVTFLISVAFFVLLNLNSSIGEPSSQPDLSKTHTKYVLPPNICVALFSFEPEEFFNIEFSFYTSENDFRQNASIDKDGNLVIWLTEKQKEVWRNENSWGYNLETLQNSENIEISDDYTKVIVNCYEETATGDIVCLAFGHKSLGIEQLLSGKEPKSININIILRDGVTGETVYNISWPQEKFEYDSEKYEFSSIKQIS